MKSFIATLVIAFIFFIALLFGSRNEQVVNISYFVAQGEFRLPIVLAVVFLAGFLLSWLFALYHIGRLKLSLRNLQRKNEKLIAQSPHVKAVKPSEQVTP